jgi:hypothetical protein
MQKFGWIGRGRSARGKMTPRPTRPSLGNKEGRAISALSAASIDQRARVWIQLAKLCQASVWPIGILICCTKMRKAPPQSVAR